MKGPSYIVFLHGYTTPTEPSRDTLTRAFASAGLNPELISPQAPSGESRRDPFNPKGEPSWFRYSTDHSVNIPQQLDDADLTDVYEVMYSSWEVEKGHQLSLWELLTQACDSHGASEVALIGESQGGVMAALLGIEWNRQHPTSQLGWLGLVRTAPDRHTWQPRPRNSDETFTFDSSWTTAPPSYTTRVSVVLGAEDLTYRASTSLAALGPLLISNRIHTPGLGFYHSPSGNVDLRVLPNVTHDSDEDLVFETLAHSMAMWAAS
jgi:hypothetical protein